MRLTVQIASILTLTLIHANAEAPPGYVKPPEPIDKNSPKYEYGYNIEDDKGAAHGKIETRDGIYALGRYYVQNADSTHNVQYYADDWGFHPYIEYGNVGPHSRSRTQLLLGVEAVKALASKKFTSHAVPPKQHVADTISTKINRGNIAPVPTVPQPILPQPILPQPLLAKTVPQPQLVVQQPQIIHHQPPQIIHHQQPQIIHHQPPQIIQHQQPRILPQPQIIHHQQPQIIQHQTIVSQPPPVVHYPAAVTPQPEIVHHQTLVTPQPQVVHHQPIVPPPQQVIHHPPPQQVELQQQFLLEQQPQVIHQQEITFEQQQAPVPPQPSIDQQQFLQQQDAQSDSVVIEASGRQPQQQQVSISNEISHPEPLPQALPLIKENYVFNQNHIESNQAEFGARLNLEARRKPVFNVQVTPQRLIETTRNLVSGQDVLNINRAIGEKIESSTLSSLRSFSNEPIVVADFEDKIVSSTDCIHDKEQIVSTTASTIGSLSSKSFGITEPSSILVTPRPISTNFLASTRLHRVETSTPKPNYLVEVQKSLPLLELQQSHIGTLGQLELVPQLQQLPQVAIRDNFVQVTPAPVVIEKIVEKIVPVVQTKTIEKPVEVTKYIKEPYPVQVPVHVPVQVPYPVEKKIHVPVPVERIVEKPVKVTEVVEKHIHVPQPYPVEKIVEKQVPVEVTKYIDRPYPVQVPVATPVPYPVERIVERIVKQPYPVQVEVKVPVPVEKIIERKVPVPQYIDRPVTVEKIVEKAVPHYIDRPYPVQVGIPVAEVYGLPLQVPGRVNTLGEYQKVTKLRASSGLQVQLQKQLQGQVQAHLQRQTAKQNLLLQSTSGSGQYLPPLQQNNGYLPPHDCDQHNSYSGKNSYYTIPNEDYIGLAPPKLGLSPNLVRKYRNPRSSFNSNLRLEYGFMPPLRPSQEIDEHGHPISRESA